MNLRKKAFTLIELIIVLAIIGILIVALLPTVTGAPARARDAQRKKNLNDIAAALESYSSDRGAFPGLTTQTAGYCLTKADLSGGGTPLPEPDFDNLSVYLKGGIIPRDPTLANLSACGTATGYYFYKRLTDGYLLGATTETPSQANTACSAAITTIDGINSGSVKASSLLAPTPPSSCSGTTKAYYIVFGG